MKIYVVWDGFLRCPAGCFTSLGDAKDCSARLLNLSDKVRGVRHTRVFEMPVDVDKGDYIAREIYQVNHEDF